MGQLKKKFLMSRVGGVHLMSVLQICEVVPCWQHMLAKVTVFPHSLGRDRNKSNPMLSDTLLLGWGIVKNRRSFLPALVKTII
jgi:hypothetical protein